MPRRSVFFRTLLSAVAVIFTAQTASAAQLLIFAAASMADVLEEIGRAYATTGEEAPRISIGSSGNLARQIDAGAPADIFLSANRKWMSYLSDRGRLEGGTVTDLLHNRLVLIAPRDEAPAGDLVTILKGLSTSPEERIAIADPDHVPAGIYAKEALTSLGLWQSLASRAVFGSSVRHALAFVERGETAVGIVYATDARESERVTVVGWFPADTHSPIVYQIATVAGRRSPASDAYMAFLVSGAATAILERHGFVVE